MKAKRSLSHRALLGVFVAAAMISSAHAASVTWDITPGTVGAGDSAITGGAGTWNTNTTLGNWTIDGGVNNIAWVNANNDTAIFGGTAGTVTLGEDISAGGLTFSTDGYTIAGAYKLDLTASGNITNNAGSITFTDGVTVTNFTNNLYIAYNANSKTLSFANGASFYSSGTAYVGYNDYNALNVGGPGAASTVSVKVLDIGANGAPDYNTVTVTNGTLLVTNGNLRIGYANTGGPNTSHNNKMTVLKDGTVDVKGAILVCTGNNTHSGNSLVVSNGSVSATGAITLGTASAILLVVDGGQLATVGATINNNSVQVIGGAEVSTWNLGKGTLSGSGSTITVDGRGVAGSAVLTNVCFVTYGGDIVVTNGARLFTASTGDLYTDPALGQGSGGLIVTIVGGTSDSILDGVGGNLKVGEYGGTVIYSGNQLIVDAGGIVTNVTGLHIGKKGNSASYSNAYDDKLVVTNGGKVFTSAASSIGYCGSRGATFRGNTATVTGTGSLWNLGGAVLTVGYSGAYANYITNNALIVSNGGVVTNAGLIYVSDGDATDCRFNLITVNNGSIYSVGLNIGDNGSPNNSVSVENGGTWNMGAGNITVGSGAGTGNALTVGAGSVLTNAGTITVVSGNAIQLDGGAEIHGNITLNGTGISSGGALRNISGTNTYGRTITLGSATRINSDAGLLILDVASGNAITGNYNLTFGGAGNITVADPINIGSGTLTKDGTGTLTLSGINTYTNTTTVLAGTLALGASGTLDTDNNVVLAGGTLSAGDFNNSLGTLTLSASSTIALGSGTLSFANSSALAGTWSGTLDLTGALGPTTLRFGTDANGLTEAQLDSITYLGQPVSLTINAQGYILAPAAGGTVYRFR